MPVKDLTGQRFGRLVVIERGENHKSPSGLQQVRWLCQCDCGNQTLVHARSLTSGTTLSCGCYNKDKNKRIFTTHGKRKTKLYGVWRGILNRCYDIKHHAYPSYGGRSIKMCEEWKNNFENFYEWAYANGYKDNERLTIDRIDNNGNYEPSNCRWVDYKTQANNTRRNVVLEFEGQRKTIAEWGDTIHIPATAIWKRIKRGWSIQDALTKPLRITRR